MCLKCDAFFDRDYIQGKLVENNSIDFEKTAKMIRPDGDVEIASVTNPKLFTKPAFTIFSLGFYQRFYSPCVRIMWRSFKVGHNIFWRQCT